MGCYQPGSVLPAGVAGVNSSIHQPVRHRREVANVRISAVVLGRRQKGERAVCVWCMLSDMDCVYVVCGVYCVCSAWYG